MTRDPLDAHETFRAAVFDDEDHDGHECTVCDWCDRPADTLTREGFPICTECAEERRLEARAVDRARHGRSPW